MRFGFLRQPLAMAGALCFALLAFPATASDVDVNVLTEKVDALMEAWSNDRSPGAAVLVARDGEILFKKGYGMADIESKTPIETDTAFLLASITKPFTALSIIMCEERGLLDYDDSLRSFFPQFPRFMRGITVRHLLHHTAGLYEYERLFIRNRGADRDWPRSAKTPPSDFEPTSEETLDILSELEKVRFEPGSKFEYSNSAYVLLAQIVEKVDGRKFTQFIQQEILDPVGMDRSLLYDESKPVVERRATSYEPLSDDAAVGSRAYRDIDYTPFNLIYGEDNLFSTVEDLFKFDQALYTEKLVSAASLEEAFKGFELDSGETTPYGFGWFLLEENGKRTVFHGGSWVGFRNSFVREIDEGNTYIFLSNSVDSPNSQMRAELPRILRESIRD